MNTAVAEPEAENDYRRCADFRDCNLKECLFYEGDRHCWRAITPFKKERSPAVLLRDTADRCECMSIPCSECEYFEGKVF